jgi:hypothetical protein
LVQNPIDSDRSYQIFKREADNTTVCIEAVKGLHEARKRLDEVRRDSPLAQFFVFDPLTQKSVDPEQHSTVVDPLTP